METAVKFEVRQVEWPGRTFLIRRDKVNFGELSQFFSKSYAKLYHALHRERAGSSGPPCAIYFSVDEKGQETDLAAAVPVPAIVRELGGFETLTIPKAKAILLSYFGPYEGLTAAYGALDSYLEEHGMVKTWTIEEYLSDPELEKDPRKWKTNIYYVLR
jgi:effector-binding domain-containing protein